MLKQVYNPDVLTCLANLSSDEVFTPPTVVNQMLDTLPKELWSDEKVTFLDPVSKSGVFLREITKRLIDGLDSKIPNLEERIEHILRNQVFGIGITELTSLISRRSLYCSKYANGKYSIVQFDDEQGNLKYFETEHTWEGGSCKYCGVNKEIYDRGEELESYSYSFIHSQNPEKLFNMKFDVIIGNPPYQMNVGVEQKNFAISIYQKFVEQGIKLSPRYLSMIIPSRWFSGGRGLDEFREKMLNDRRIRNLVDFPDSNHCFPGVSIKGGVCYFLWDRDNEGTCEIKTYNDNKFEIMNRELLEEGLDTFIRYNQGVSIINKVKEKKEESFSKIVSSQTPFGLLSSFRSFKETPKNNSIKIYLNKQTGYVEINQIPKNQQLIEDYKIYITKSYGAGEGFPHQILNKPIFGEKNSCCTQTYLLIGPFSSPDRTKRVMNYIKTKFFRFMVLMKKNSQDNMKSVFELVPLLSFDEEWTDEKLYKKYGLNEKEIEFIESMIRPME